MKPACSLQSCTAQFPRVRLLCLSLAGIQTCMTCMQPLRCAAGCLRWIAGESLEIPPRKYQALLMPLTSFFLTHALLFPNLPLYCSLSFSPLASTSLLFGAYWLRGRTCSGWKAIHPSCWESHDGQSGGSYWLGTYTLLFASSRASSRYCLSAMGKPKKLLHSVLLLSVWFSYYRRIPFSNTWSQRLIPSFQTSASVWQESPR